MGAVVNMRPDLFNAVVMGVPFVDALTTMLDDTIPLTTVEVCLLGPLLILSLLRGSALKRACCLRSLAVKSLPGPSMWQM